MTVNSTTSAVAYTGNGTTATYPYTFQIADSSDLVVYTLSADGLTLTALMDTVGYTVTGAGVATGGNVVLSAGNLGNGVYLFIATDPIQVQRLLLQQGAAFNPADLMNAFDLLTREVQATRRVANNGIQIPVAESLLGLNTVLPPKLARANSFVTFDANGLLSLLSTSAIGSVLVAGNYIVDRPAFTAGVTTALTLTQAPGTVNNAWVYFDGVYQQRNTYTVSGTTLTLGAAVPVGVASVEVVQAGVLPINTPANGSVGASAIQNNAVTAPAIMAGAVGTVALAAGAVTSHIIANGAVDFAQLAADVVSYFLPVGAMVDYGGTSAPAGWALCDGTAISRVTYATLFAAIGTNYGTGDGSNTFNLPDFRGRTAVGTGTGSGLTPRTIGATVGEETHALSVAEMPLHAHNVHTNGVSTTGTAAILRVGGAPDLDIATASAGVGPPGTAHNTMQPSLVATKIIKTS